MGAERGVRVLSINRRGYAPTSPLPAAYLEMTEDNEKQEALVLQQGVELATFVARAIVQCDIPQIEESNGGVIIIGWSLGSLITLSMLANLDRVSEKDLTYLSSHLRTVHLHGKIFSIFNKSLMQ